MEAKTSRILIVDDDPDIVRLMKTILSMKGYEVVTASNGQECLAVMAQQQRPNLILLDVNMPEMDGISTIRALRKYDHNFATPIIMLTAVEFLQPYLETDPCIKSFLVKPIEIEILLREIQQVLSPTS